ncbi:MAG: glycosyltransferase family 2 protein [Clostridia bacterium]|nr:glycosyltransferase family 2 protein [Clostridia bacterium]
MKYITFTVPCYNSAAYMRNCVDSLLPGGEDVEIVIVNDGSKDETLAIANEYAEAYPSIVRVIDKPNGGHGSGVNAGLKIAQGLYYKVVDSDDWVNGEAYAKLLAAIKKHVEESASPDLYIVNYVYEHVADNTSYVSGYRKNFTPEQFNDWTKVNPFRYSSMLLMHALVYRTDVLREQCKLELPEHTFYVDDIFSYNPLPFTKSVYYLDIDFYRYFIGRADQSVNIVNMVKRYEMQIRVMLAMTDAWSYDDICAQKKGLKKYMFHAIGNYLCTTLLFICAEDSPERRAAYKEMWRHIKERDPKLYRKLKYRTYAVFATLLPWKLRGKLLVFGYKVLCKRVKLG